MDLMQHQQQMFAYELLSEHAVKAAITIQRICNENKNIALHYSQSLGVLNKLTYPNYKIREPYLVQRFSFSLDSDLMV